MTPPQLPRSNRIIGIRFEHVTSAEITPECRTNRGADGAWDEAVARLRREYEAVVEGWRDEAEQPTLWLMLDLEVGRTPASSTSRSSEEAQ